MGNTQTREKENEEKHLSTKEEKEEKDEKDEKEKDEKIVNRMISNKDGDELLTLFRKAFKDISIEGEIMDKISKSLKTKLGIFKELKTQQERIEFIENEIKSENELINKLKKQKEEELKKSIGRTEEEKEEQEKKEKEEQDKFEIFFETEIIGRKNYVEKGHKRQRIADGRKCKPKSKRKRVKSKSKSKRKNKKT